MEAQVFISNCIFQLHLPRQHSRTADRPQPSLARRHGLARLQSQGRDLQSVNDVSATNNKHAGTCSFIVPFNAVV